MKPGDSLDIRVDTGWVRHPKTKTLKGELGLAGPWALLTLWSFARHYHTDGSLAGKSDAYIEDAAEWSGNPGALIGALLRSGYLDGAENARHLHDWEGRQAWAVSSPDRTRRNTIAALMKHGKTRDQAEKVLKRQGKKIMHDALRGAMHKTDFRSPRLSSPLLSSKSPPNTPPGGGLNGNGHPVQTELVSSLPDWLPMPEWDGYLEMRQRIKEPMTPRAVELALRKLDGFRQAGISVADVLDESTLSNWTGLYPPKKSGAAASSGKPKDYRKGIDEDGNF